MFRVEHQETDRHFRTIGEITADAHGFWIGYADEAEVARITYGDYGRLLVYFEGDPTYLREMVATVAEVARVRGVKIVPCTPELVSLLSDREYRDVVEAPLGKYESKEIAIEITKDLRLFFKRAARHLREVVKTADAQDDSWRSISGDGIAATFHFGDRVTLDLAAPENVLRQATLSAAEIDRAASGDLQLLAVKETVRAPHPMEAVIFAESFLDDLVSDGTIELTNGDAPLVRHAQVFAMAERLADQLAEWRSRVGPKDRVAGAELAQWLTAQSEVADVFGEDLDLTQKLFATTNRALPKIG